MGRRLVMLSTSVAVLAAACRLARAVTPNASTDAVSIGYEITSACADPYGVDVTFVPYLEPPHVVAIFSAAEAGLGCHFPLMAITTDGDHVRFEGPFAIYENTFVQVFHHTITNGWGEAERFRPKGMTNRWGWVSHSHGTRSWELIKPQPLPWKPMNEEERKRHWQQVAAADKRLCDIADGRDWLRPDHTSHLCGFECDRSQRWPIARFVRPLSAHNGKIVSVDWIGHRGYAPAPTNIPPGRIFFEGINQ